MAATLRLNLRRNVKRERIRRFLFSACALVSLGSLALSGCAKKEDEFQEGTFSSVYHNTLKGTCISCHVPGGAAYDISGVPLDFSSKETAYQTLLSKDVSGQSSSASPCGGKGIRIVNPNHPSDSYLVGVLIADYAINNFAGVSGCLPYAGHLYDTHLSTSEKSSLIKWIQGGAQND